LPTLSRIGPRDSPTVPPDIADGDLQLPDAGRPDQPLCALGFGCGNRSRRYGLPVDAEPAGLPRRWLGISKVGAVVALINTRLVGQSLSHCINLANADHVILAADLAAVFDSAVPYLARTPKIWLHGGAGTAAKFDAALERMDASPLTSAERRGTVIDDRALLIYTSGTTGLPKAASISHRRILNWGGWFAGLTDASIEDRLYDCLPLFHSVGGIVAPCSMLSAEPRWRWRTNFPQASSGAMWCAGIAPCFSISASFAAICSRRPGPNSKTATASAGLRQRAARRYLASLPGALCDSPDPGVYAATEGNFSLYNVEGRPGAIGRIPPLLAHRFPAAIIRLDAESGVAVRGEDGLCIRCGRDEVGEAIGRIGTADGGGGRFEGYTDAGETEKKSCAMS